MLLLLLPTQLQDRVATPIKENRIWPMRCIYTMAHCTFRHLDLWVYQCFRTVVPDNNRFNRSTQSEDRSYEGTYRVDITPIHAVHHKQFARPNARCVLLIGFRY